MPVQIVDDLTLKVKLGEAGKSLVVLAVFSYAQQSDPEAANAIACFHNVSASFPGVVFLRIDADSNPATMLTNVVTDTPCYIFFRNSRELNRLRSGNLCALVNRVKQLSAAPVVKAKPSPSKISKPTKFLPAFHWYVQTKRDLHVMQNPNKAMPFQEFAKLCEKEWKDMSSGEKQEFKALAEQDKDRYERELREHRKVMESKQKKDPNAPKKPIGPFIFFSKERRGDVLKSMPGAQVGLISQELGRLWNNLSPNSKAKYQTLAEKERERYMKEKEAYLLTKGKMISNDSSSGVDDEDQDSKP